MSFVDTILLKFSLGLIPHQPKAPSGSGSRSGREPFNGYNEVLYQQELQIHQLQVALFDLRSKNATLEEKLLLSNEKVHDEQQCMNVLQNLRTFFHQQKREAEHAAKQKKPMNTSAGVIDELNADNAKLKYQIATTCLLLESRTFDQPPVDPSTQPNNILIKSKQTKYRSVRSSNNLFQMGEKVKGNAINMTFKRSNSFKNLQFENVVPSTSPDSNKMKGILKKPLTPEKVRSMSAPSSLSAPIPFAWRHENELPQTEFNDDIFERSERPSELKVHFIEPSPAKAKALSPSSTRSFFLIDSDNDADDNEVAADNQHKSGNDNWEFDGGLTYIQPAMPGQLS